MTRPTMTFDLLTLKSNQFIFIPNYVVNLLKFQTKVWNANKLLVHDHACLHGCTHGHTKNTMLQQQISS